MAEYIDAPFQIIFKFGARDLPGQNEGPPVRGIYAILNRFSNNFYIGSSEHVFRRFRHHVNHLRRGIHHSLRLQWAWKNKSEDTFVFILIEVASADLDLIARENEFISEFRPEYNTAVAADNPMLGRKHSPESIAKMRRNRAGKGMGSRPPLSPQTRAKMSDAAKLRDPDTRVGGERSPEARKRMSDGQRAAYAAGLINARTRPIELDGARFSAGKDAAAHFGISHALVIKRIKAGRGRYLDKTA